MLIAFLSTCSVSFQRPHCPSPCSSWSYPTSLLYNNSNILFATLCALIVLFSAYCHPYHAYRSPPLPTKKNPVAFPIPLSSLRVSQSSFCMPAIILIILLTCCHPHCSSSLGKWMNVFLIRRPFHASWCSLLSFPKPLVVPLVPMLHYHPFSCQWSAKKQFSAATITPQHPCCPHGTTTEKTKSQTPWTHSEPFFYPRRPERHQAWQPCKNYWIWILFLIVQTEVKFTCRQCSSSQATLYSWLTGKKIGN